MATLTQVPKSKETGEPTTAPGPAGHFLLGSAPEIRKGDAARTVSNWHTEYGSIVRFKLGKNLFHSISDPDILQDIMVRRYKDFPKITALSYKIGLPLLIGQGLVTANGSHWRKHRRILQPVFKKSGLKPLGPKIEGAGQAMLERWQNIDEEESVDLSEEMMKVTLDIICRTMFSTDVLEQTDDIRRAMDICLNFCFRHLASPLRMPIELPFPAHLRFKKARGELYKIIDGMIESHRNHPEKYDDLLMAMLSARDDESGEALGDQELREETLTVFGAGHETTSHALSWTFHLLSQNPDCLRKVQEELDRELGDSAVTIADLPRLEYLQRVFDESMRIHPPVPSTPRTNENDEILGGYFIPARTRIFLSYYNMHHNPAYWTNPETFDPDRFLPERNEPRHKNAYLPFGAGPRMCIGNHLALMEGRLILAMVLQKYTPRHDPAAPPVEARTYITMRPEGGLWMNLHRRR